MAYEHVTSGGFTFAQHMALASAWCQYNGWCASKDRSLRVMREIPAPTLWDMLIAHDVAIPIGCEEQRDHGAASLRGEQVK
jgi:hypothetical protein